jgi:hypothetical protein
VASLCLLLACRPQTVAAERAPAAKDSVGPLWEKGAAYGFDLHSTAFVDLGQARTAVHYQLDGVLTVTVADEREGRATLHLRLLAPKTTGLSPGGIEAPERFSHDLEEGDAIAIVAGGKLVELGFREGAATPVVTTFRQLAASLQVAVARGAKDALAEEYDTTGRYLAAYAFEHATGTLLKTKIRYLAPLGSPKGPSLLPTVTGSEGRIRVSPGGRLESLVQKDALAMEGAGMPIRAETTLELRLRKVEQVEAAAPAALLAGFTRVAASEPAASQAQARGLDQARTGGASFRELVSRLRVAGDERDASLFNALAAALRTEAGAPAQAVRMVVAGSRLSPVLVDGLGAAACPACEAALIELLRALPADTQARALHALARFGNPGEPAIAAMKARLAEQAYDPTALYALGAYARLFAERGKPEKAAELGRLLVGRLEEARGSMQKIVALRAVENSGRPEALSLLPRFTDDQDASVRGAARLAAAAIGNTDGRSR